METEWTWKAAVLQVWFRTGGISAIWMLLKYRLLGPTPELLDPKSGIKPRDLCCKRILMLREPLL